MQDYASSADTSVATGKLVSQLLNFLSRMTAVAEPRVRLTTPSQVRKLLRLEASQLNIEVAMLLDTSAVIRADAYLNRTGEVRMHIDPLASPSWHLRPPLSGPSALSVLLKGLCTYGITYVCSAAALRS